MKNRFFIMCLIVLTISILSACKKYEENPLINLRSRTFRLEDGANYTPSGFWINGVDSMASLTYRGYVDFFEDEGQKLIHTGFINGIWHFDDHKQILHIDMDNTNSYSYGVLLSGTPLDWKITKLTNRELHITIDYKGKNYVVHLNK